MNIEKLISKKDFVGCLYLINDEKEIRCTLHNFDVLNNKATFLTIQGIEIYNRFLSEGKDTTEFLSNEKYVKVFNISDIKDFITAKGFTNQII